MSVNRVPVFTSGGAALELSVAEGSVPVITLAAVDAAVDALSYRIVGGADAALFRFGEAARGALSFVTPPDYETPGDADGDNRYRVEVAVSDGRGFSDGLAALDLSRWWRADWAKHDFFANDWSPNQIGFADGKMAITLQQTSSGFVSGQYFSQQRLHYGYYEARLKASGARTPFQAIISANDAWPLLAAPADGTTTAAANASFHARLPAACFFQFVVLTEF